MRKWLLSLNVLLSLLLLRAIVAMLNYLGARHFQRFEVSTVAQTELTPLTKRVLASVTNEIKVTIFFDREEPLYESVQALLKEYKYANSKISVETIDDTRSPGAAGLIKEK